jgi:hypothetical protein
MPPNFSRLQTATRIREILRFYGAIGVKKAY